MMNFTVTEVTPATFTFACEGDADIVQQLIAAVLVNDPRAGRSSTTAATREETTPLPARRPAGRQRKRKSMRRSEGTVMKACEFCGNRFPALANKRYCTEACRKKAGRITQGMNGREALPELPPAA
jgi:hypothetical protein